VPVENQVDAVDVGPDGEGPPGQALPDGQVLAAGHDDEVPAGRDAGLELDGGAARDRQRRRGDNPFLCPGQGDLVVLGGRRRDGDVAGRAVGAEPAGRDSHVQGLVGPLVVVGVDPAVDAGLRCFQGLERRDVVQQLGSQALVEPLDLPRGRR
jgi:hypothetical protein